jgi:hypothetical protein
VQSGPQDGGSAEPGCPLTGNVIVGTDSDDTSPGTARTDIIPGAHRARLVGGGEAAHQVAVADQPRARADRPPVGPECAGRGGVGWLHAGLCLRPA